MLADHLGHVYGLVYQWVQAAFLDILASTRQSFVHLLRAQMCTSSKRFVRLAEAFSWLRVKSHVVSQLILAGNLDAIVLLRPDFYETSLRQNMAHPVKFCQKIVVTWHLIQLVHAN